MNVSEQNRVEQLKILYEKKLRFRLDVLEAERKHVRDYAIASGMAVAISAFFHLQFGIKNFFFEVIAIIAASGLSLWTYILRKKYRTLYKQKIVREVFQLINPSWEYTEDGYVNQSIFQESDLYREEFNRYTGDDWVKGTLGKTPFEMSEINVEHITGSGKSRSRHTVFHGLFFVADFNKHLKERTFIFPDIAGQTFLNFIGKKVESFAYAGHGNRIQLENSDFEKVFAVFADSTQEAFYVLTPKIMEQLLRLKRRLKAPLRMALHSGKIFVSIDYRRDLFEPRLFSPGTSFSDIREIAQLFETIELIIADMDLNTRIWTKS